MMMMMIKTHVKEEKGSFTKFTKFEHDTLRSSYKHDVIT